MIAAEFPDLEMLLKDYLAGGLVSWSPLVGRRFPDKAWAPGFAVVIRDDSGGDLTLITATRNVGLTCIGPDTSYQQTRQMAERAATLLRAAPEASTLPIADATVRGPYSLDATGRVEFYLTAALTVVGHPVTI